MRDQNSSPPMNNMLVGINNINFILMRDQNLPPPMNNMLIGEITSILFIFIRDQNSPPPNEQYVDRGNIIIFIFIRDQISPSPMNNMLTGVITSTLSSWPPEVRRRATSGLQRTNSSVFKVFALSSCGESGIAKPRGSPISLWLWAPKKSKHHSKSCVTLD